MTGGEPVKRIVVLLRFLVSRVERLLRRREITIFVLLVALGTLIGIGSLTAIVWRGALPAVLVVCIVLASSLLIWLLPRIQLHHLRPTFSGAEYIANLNESRKTISQIAAGFILVAGLYSALNTITATNKTFALTEKAQVTDRLMKAVELLKQEKPSDVMSRLAGIYILGRVAEESQIEHGPVIDLLTAYVRVNARRTATDLQALPPDSKVVQEVQSALSVLAQRNIRFEQLPTQGGIITMPDGREMRVDHRLDLSLVQAPRAELNFCQFDRANLSGSILFRSQLVAGHFAEADFYGTDLRRCNARGADFRRADLRSAVLDDGRFLDVDFRGAYVENASFNNCDLGAANFATVVGLVQGQVDSAKGDQDTRLPNGISRPATWPQKSPGR